MQVRCERNVGPNGEDLGGPDWALTRGSTYVVLAVHANTSRTSLRILCEGGGPIIVNAACFSVTDPSLPPGWSVEFDSPGSFTVTHSSLNKPYDWEGYFDGRFAAVVTYEQALADILTLDRQRPEPSPVGLRHRPAELRTVLPDLDLDPSFVGDRVHLTLAELAAGFGYGWITTAEVVEVLERQLLTGVELSGDLLDLACLPRWNEPAIEAALWRAGVTREARADHAQVWMHLALERVVQSGATSGEQARFVERFFVTTGYPRWMNDFVPAMHDGDLARIDASRRLAEEHEHVRNERWTR